MIFEGLPTEVIHAFLYLAITVIVYYAWKSTNVRDIPPAAVLIIENNRRRLLENVVRPQPAPSLQDILEEVSDLALSGGSQSVTTSRSETDDNNGDEDNDDIEQQEIIHNMDTSSSDEINTSSEGIRHRRLPENSRNSNDEAINQQQLPLRRENLNVQVSRSGDGNSSASGDSTHAENCSNENNENENISKSETSNVKSNDVQYQQQINKTMELNTKENITANQINNDEFVIKLKFLNDDLRLVKGSPHEALGDFKKKHFTVELKDKKVVRLVFNGHVLQPDTKTLQAFGLFDNCVVHCLVHKAPGQSNNQNQSGSTNMQPDQISNNNNNNNNRQQRSRNTNDFLHAPANGQFYVNLAVTMTSLVLVFCWFCRFQYSSFFSLYSTIGLILMTALFIFFYPALMLREDNILHL